MCMVFGLVWFLTFGATQQSTELMCNSVADLFFQFMNFFLQFLLSGTISIPYLFNGCKMQILCMTRTTKTGAQSQCNWSNNFPPKRYYWRKGQSYSMCATVDL